LPCAALCLFAAQRGASRVLVVITSPYLLTASQCWSALRLSRHPFPYAAGGLPLPGVLVCLLVLFASNSAP
jgi:hypothetical protein